MAFLNYFTIVSNGMLGLSRIFVIVSRASASANRIEEVLTAPEDLAELPAGDAPESPYHIEFRNVTFSYNKRKPTLSNISFRLKRGESLGLIGATGSGKSTILLLLMRFYDVDEGEILIDGVNIKQIPAEKLHRMFGVTFQSDVVYADTAHENIVLGREISEESVDRAVHNAQAAYLLELADGLNAHLNSQGTNLSGRTAAAPADRPRAGRQPGNSAAGRRVQRTRLPHRRKPAHGAAHRTWKRHVHRGRVARVVHRAHDRNHRAGRGARHCAGTA